MTHVDCRICCFSIVSEHGRGSRCPGLCGAAFGAMAASESSVCMKICSIGENGVKVERLGFEV
jgi:hypothetical protein